MPNLLRTSLAAALKSFGPAQIFVGDPFTADGMQNLGAAMEGDRSFEVTYARNALTAPEFTGDDIAHVVRMNVQSARITCRVILGDPALYLKINPFGIDGGGTSGFRQPKRFGVLIISDDDIPEAGIKLAGALGAPVWTPAAPTRAIWLWRAYVEHGSLPFSFADGGKGVADVTFHAMYRGGYGAADAETTPLPEGHKVFTFGDPRAVLDIAGAAAEIPALLGS